MPRPEPNEYASFHANYVSLVPEAEILPALRSDLLDTTQFLQGISEDDSLIRHAPYTWSTREVVGHLIDCDRIFGYRALRFARCDSTPLAGFDENAYANVAGSDSRSLSSLTAELDLVRRANLALFESFGDDEAIWSRVGTANGVENTVRAVAYLIVGHGRRHFSILKGRFGK